MFSALSGTRNEISTYLDTPENVVLSVPIDQSFWERGGWSENEALDNPWRGQKDVAPFDQKFYLTFNVAVGGAYFSPIRNLPFLF